MGTQHLVSSIINFPLKLSSITRNTVLQWSFPSFCRLQDAGGLQHYRQDFCWNERCFHGAGLLQQLHCLQGAQRFLHKPAHKVRPQANGYLRCVNQSGSVITCIFPALSLSHVSTKILNSLCGHRSLFPRCPFH